MRRFVGTWEDLTGERFGSLVVLNECGKRPDGGPIWECLCDCGNRCTRTTGALKSGKSKSCGHIQRETVTTHGQFKTRLYRIWIGMKTRCYNPKSTSYKTYGGRGIKVCAEWKTDFQAFYDWATEHGYKDTLSIDRIDNDKDYEPANCRFISITDNVRKSLTERKTSPGCSLRKPVIACDKETGKTLFEFASISEAARRLHVSAPAIRHAVCNDAVSCGYLWRLKTE